MDSLYTCYGVINRALQASISEYIFNLRDGLLIIYDIAHCKKECDTMFIFVYKHVLYAFRVKIIFLLTKVVKA